MKQITLLLILSVVNISLGQNSSDSLFTHKLIDDIKNEIKAFKDIKQQSAIQSAKLNSIVEKFIAEYQILYDIIYPAKTDLSTKAKTYLKQDHKYINSAGNELMALIFEMEGFTYYNMQISSGTRRLINHLTDPYMVVIVERAIKENLVKDDIKIEDSTYFFKEKILKEVSNQLNLLTRNKFPYYTYETKNKQMVKFISIKTGNDLFVFTQKNEDRDYTGSFLIEVGTDYLNPLRRRPIKTYQTFLYGFEVFTPSFRDTTKFKNFNSIDSLDRPHASFQFFGWSKKGLSKLCRLRWSTTLKFGKIGGRAGEAFQTGLHQDVSYSLRPKGWDAQIANGGRLGISLETSHEYQFSWPKNPKKPNSFTNFNLSPFVEGKLGTYMTNASIGIQFSNKKFSQTNHNFINHRTRQGTNTRVDHLMYNVSFKATYVGHNTMLEGYGIFFPTEAESDTLTPKSIYVLQYNQVRRIVYTTNVCLSYTTRFGTLFYNWFVFSPETYLKNLKTTNPNSANIDLTNRWHHFAEIGLTFNIHK